MSSRRFPRTLLAVSVIAGLACAAAWLLPPVKPGGVLGRLSYPEFLLALVLSGLFATSLIVLLSSGASRRAVAIRLGLLWLGGLVALIATEASAVYMPVNGPLNNPWYMTGEAAVLASKELPFVRPPHVEWTGVSQGDIAMMMGARDPYARRVTFRTDHQGFRNRHDLDQADLIFVGDSATEAGNIPEDETFVQLAATRSGCSVRNLGRTGYTTLEELIVLRQYGLPSEPKTVVWQISESTDLAEAVHTQQWIAAGRPPLVDQSNHLEPIDIWKHRSLSFRLFNWLREMPPWPTSGTFVDADGRRHAVAFLTVPGPEHCPRDNPGWQPFVDALKGGKALLDEQHVDLVVLLLPIKLRAIGHATELRPETLDQIGDDWDLPEEETLATALAAICEKLGVPFIDATPTLREAAQEGQLVFLPLDVHLSPLGHQRVAELLAPALDASQVGSR